MLPTLAQPLASIASGAALPASGAAAAPRPTLPAGGLATAAAVADVVDAFVGIAKKAGLLPGAASTASRARSSGSGYAAASATGSAAAKKTSSAKTKSTAAKSTSAKTAATTAKKAGPLAFLQDRTLSVEEKLMRLLAYLNDKWDKDLEKKMKEIEAGQQKAAAPSAAASSPAAPKKKSSGVLGSIGAIVKTASGFFPAVGVAMEALKNPTVRAALSKLGGPVLAAAASALGYPALAPLLLKYGPAVVDVAAGLATSLDAGGATATATPTASSAATSTASASASAAASSPSATGMNDSELRLKLIEIERIQNLQKEMFSLVSSILRAGHETRMNVIQNIR